MKIYQRTIYYDDCKREILFCNQERKLTIFDYLLDKKVAKEIDEYCALHQGYIKFFGNRELQFIKNKNRIGIHNLPKFKIVRGNYIKNNMSIIEKEIKACIIADIPYLIGIYSKKQKQVIVILREYFKIKRNCYAMVR